MIIDTNIAIKRLKANEDIHENITIITAMEFPPILNYAKFYGTVYTIKPEDQVLAIKIQRKLRIIGKPKPVPDVLIAAICINRKEEVKTKDRDFRDIAEVSDLKVRFL